MEPSLGQLYPNGPLGGNLYCKYCVVGKHKSRFATEISTQNLHATLGPVLVTAQCFGLLPVHGVLASSPRALHYQPRSFRTLYAHALLVSIALLALLSTIHMARELRSKTFSVLGGLGAATAGAVFYGNALCATWLFLRLAPRWGALMRRWTDIEFRLDLGGGGNIATRSPFLLTSAVLCFATAEHALSIAINLRSASNNNNSSNSTHGWLQTYATSSHNFIFTLVEYSTFRGILILIFSHIATFTWNFMDLFIMLMSDALTRRFRQFNTILMENEGKLVSRGWWREAREQYAALASLTRTLDHCIAGITLLSFSNNLYFVCLQLLNSLAPTSSEPSTVETAYFWGSFSFLVSRMGAVTLLASNVHHSSREALPALFACPSVAFCEEVARLQQHMCGCWSCCDIRSGFIAIQRGSLEYVFMCGSYNNGDVCKQHDWMSHIRM
ncbi:hypothetical protein B566_EDAN008874 [Ephemera danica]|nr:hypothetical protein B566_EDAN008874 [Ephemera danica]